MVDYEKVVEILSSHFSGTRKYWCIFLWII